MLHALFGFSGRIGRLTYVLSLVGLCVGAALLGLVLGIAMAGAGAEGIGTGLVLAGLIAVPVLWGSFALMTKRVRDMGLPPLPVTAFLLFVAAADLLVLGHLTAARFFPPFQDYTPVGGMVQLAFLAALLFWPSEADHPGGLSAMFAGEEPPKPEPRLVPAEPARMAARQGFGRRG